MDQTIVLVHTVSPLIAVFDRLAATLLPGVRLKHILDEPLLEAISQRGGLADMDAWRLLAHVSLAEQIGARAVLVTCSTASPLVDQVRKRAHLAVFKIDEAMISQAVESAAHLGVLATNPLTLPPTRQLLEQQAERAGRQVEIELVLVEGAFQAFLSGDGALHDRLVRQAYLDLAPRVGAVVLAQASMARVLEVLPPEERPVPLFSSPHLVLEAVGKYLAIHG